MSFSDFLTAFSSGLANSGATGGLAAGARGFTGARKNVGLREATKLANQGDWQGAVDTLNNYDPDSAFQLVSALKTAQDQKTLREINKSYNTTNEIKNYEALRGMGVDDETARKIAFKIKEQQEKDPYQDTFVKLQAKEDYEQEKEQKGLEREIGRLEATKERLFGDDGLVKKANVGYGRNAIMGEIERRTPTKLLSPEQQQARQEIVNIMGGLRLDQMQYLKGAISDKEQEFLDKVVSGDITKYTPDEMLGTFNSIINKAKQKTIQQPKKSKYTIVEVK